MYWKHKYCFWLGWEPNEIQIDCRRRPVCTFASVYSFYSFIYLFFYTAQVERPWLHPSTIMWHDDRVLSPSLDQQAAVKWVTLVQPAKFAFWLDVFSCFHDRRRMTKNKPTMVSRLTFARLFMYQHLLECQMIFFIERLWTSLFVVVMVGLFCFVFFKGQVSP